MRFKCVLVYYVVMLIYDHCIASCNQTFQNTLAEVSLDGEVFLQEHINGCLEHRPVKKIVFKGFVPSLYKGAISNLPDLEEFRVDGAGLRYIYSDFCYKVPSLHNVTINFNPIVKLEAYVFSAYTLTTLNLSCNMIQKIGDHAFENTKLLILDLSNNRLLTINSNAFKKTTTIELQLQNNNILYLPRDTFKGVTYVHKINLNNNKIYHIEDQAFVVNGKKGDLSVYLRGNALTRIDFLTDTTLKYLDVSLNKISYLFMKNSTTIKTIRTCPNPWHCTCLWNFWKFAEEREITIEEAPIQYDGPVCIAQTSECKKNYNYDKVRDLYFHAFNYETYWYL